MKRILTLATAAAALALAGPASAFPDKPVTMIIPLGAGGSHDLNARVITSVLPTYLGQPVIVQLMPGAGGQTGTAAAAQAEADGHTMIFTHNFIDQLQQFVANVPYKPNEDFVAVARPNTAQPILVVREDSEFKTFDDLVAYGKANPGKLRFGHSGNWGAFMVPGAALLQAAGVQGTLVPYQGGGPAMQALLAGDSDFTMAFASVLSGQEGKLRPLLVIGDEKILEGVPTTAELGYQVVTDIGVMHRGVMVPAGVPAERLEILRAAFDKLAEDETYKGLMDKLGENTAHMDGAEFQKLRETQAAAYKELVETFKQ